MSHQLTFADSEFSTKRGPVGDFELLLCHGTVCVVGKMRDLILQLSKSSIYSTKSITDNRGDSNAQLPVDIGKNKNITNKYYTYGVGFTNDGKKIGNYGMWMTGTTADGKTVDSIANNHDWSATSWKYSGIPRSDAFQTIAFAQTGTTTPLAITTANFNFVTNLVIWDTSTLAITDDTPLDGQNTMTLVYL
nr:hypothetical protein [Enterobacter cloacae]